MQTANHFSICMSQTALLGALAISVDFSKDHFRWIDYGTKKQSDRQNIKHDLPAIFFEVLESRFPNELLFLSRFINSSLNFGVSRSPSLPAGSHVEESRRWVNSPCNQ